MTQEIEVTAAEIEAGEVYPMRGIEAEFLYDALDTYILELVAKEESGDMSYDEDDLAEISRKIRTARRIQERLGAFVTAQQEHDPETGMTYRPGVGWEYR